MWSRPTVCTLTVYGNWTPCRSELDHLGGEILAEDLVSYKPSMFIWINRSLGLPYMEQVAVRKVGESDTSRFKLFGLLWWLVSYIHVDDVGESGPFSVTFYSMFMKCDILLMKLCAKLFHHNFESLGCRKLSERPRELAIFMHGVLQCIYQQT